jgi:hypothetical protein
VSKELQLNPCKFVEICESHPPATIISSDCPLASDHINQGVRNMSEKETTTKHPIELLATSYDLHYD